VALVKYKCTLLLIILLLFSFLKNVKTSKRNSLHFKRQSIVALLNTLQGLERRHTTSEKLTIETDICHIHILNQMPQMTKRQLLLMNI